MKKTLFILILLGLTTNAFSQKRKIKVFVDERTELITVTQLLFGYPLVGKTDIKYKQDVLDSFQKYEDDSTVKNLLKTTQQNFSFSKPFLFTYHFSFPDFKEEYAFTKQDVEDLSYDKRTKELLSFNQNLKDFYDKTNFHDFYKKHQPLYRKIAAGVGKDLNKYNLVQTLENHYGEKQESYNLVLSPLSIEAGYSIWIKGKNGFHLYSIVGPKIDSKVEPQFDSLALMKGLAVHEFSHPFCNPLIDANYAALEKDSCLFEPLKKDLAKQGCGDWKDALKEFLTRANEIVLVKKVFGKAEADKVYDEYMSQGWLHIKGLIPIIEKYENNRRKYKKLSDIMPEVLLYFDNEAASCRR